MKHLDGAVASGWEPGQADAIIRITAAGLAAALQRRTPRHDKDGEAHYDTISAFIKSLRASDVDAAKLAVLRRRFKIVTTRDNAALVRDARVVVIAVKPQIIDVVLAEMRPSVTGAKLFVSIAAGVTTARLEAGLGGAARVLRVMPNTPALLGKGVLVLVGGRHATPADARVGRRLLGAVGQAVVVQDERLLDAATGLSGSGPAYVYLFAEGPIAGAGHRAGHRKKDGRVQVQGDRLQRYR